MRAVIYTRVSTQEQSTQRQINELKKVEGFEVVKVFSENISGFSKPMEERKALQDMLRYILDGGIKCVMIHEVSRLGRNTQEVLNLIQTLKDKGICIYIHNLGTTINNGSEMSDVFTKLVVTIMADLARLESEQMSYRIRSGIRNRKARGLTTGRQVGTVESKEKFLAKHKDIIKYLELGRSYSEMTKLCGCSMSTIRKVKLALEE